LIIFRAVEIGVEGMRPPGSSGEEMGARLRCSVESGLGFGLADLFLTPSRTMTTCLVSGPGGHCRRRPRIVNMGVAG
jgi:hypothetical protein